MLLAYIFYGKEVLKNILHLDSEENELHIEYRNNIRPIHIVRYGVWGEAQADDLLTAIYLMVVSLVEMGFINPN